MLSEEYIKERGTVGEDIHEGKRTLMVIDSCSPSNDKISQVKKNRLIEILNMKTNDQIILQEAIDILHESGSIKYAQDTAKEMLISAWEDLEPHLPNG